MDIQEILSFSFIFPLAAGIIFGFLVLYMFREDVQKDNYLVCVSGYMNIRSSRMKPLLFSDFDNIPNAANLVEKYSFDSDPSIRVKIVTDENMNLLSIEILRDHFNKIPKAPEIFVNILGTVMTTSTSGDDEIIFQDVIRIFSKHFYEIPDAEELLEIFMTIVNKKEYLKELCKQQYFKNFFVNIPNGMEILKKNRII
ncbi:hypothetical protein CVT91_05260 [Candidatus Atribacteria bacterium HGW-Atribacteria-1]|nr:MAG: hypothetical protein CVT91_05260 [Candidatus Atribacteria bacterium HGW-Atribacteria-1]